MAGKYKYKDEHFMKAAENSGGFVSVIANRIGCSYNTVFLRMKTLPELKEKIEEEREVQLDNAEGRLQELINEKNPTAIIFFLKTRAKKRGYVERQEVTGPDGDPLALTWSDDK